MTESLPSVFVSHGAPSLPLEETPARGFLEGLGGELGRPEAVLCVSAHWETAAPALSLAASEKTVTAKTPVSTDGIYEIGFHIHALNHEDWDPSGSRIVLRVEPAEAGHAGPFSSSK